MISLSAIVPAKPGSEAAMKAEVARTMGLEVDGGLDVEVPRDPESLKRDLAKVRAMLQALDDITDWDLLETADDELYKLHRAVEYKLRSHKTSEAKAKLKGLFKS